MLLKRGVDIVAGTVLALAVTPLVLMLAVALAVTFRASPFFVQERVGRGGRPFRIVKLRTLPPSTPAYADKYALQAVRLPALPRMLRALHLDELPQLWLVPLGRMSLVGPRPEMAFLMEKMPATVLRRRISVRPGCTGLWQVSVHSDGLIHEHPEYDLAYVDNHSLRLDLFILWQTLRMLVGGARILTLQTLPDWAVPTRPAAMRDPGDDPVVVEARTHSAVGAASR